MVLYRCSSLTLKQTHLFGTAPLCCAAYIQQSKCRTQRIRTAPLACEEASWSGRVGWFGTRVDSLAEVSV